jgi:peptide/nickel transport system substrate-binding protein
VEGFSLPDKRSDRVVLEANLEYWDTTRWPRLQRIIFDNTLAQHDAVELVKTGEGRVDLVSELSPLETLRVAQSPFAKVVKNRDNLGFLFGQFNMRKAGSLWRDVRLRQAVNTAINREDLIRYAAKGNGVIVPALLAVNAFGYNPDLAPYAFDPGKARALLREAGYADGLAVTLIAPPPLEVQATVVGKMLEQVGFTVERQMLEPAIYNRKTRLSELDQPAEHQAWDIALTLWNDPVNFPPMQLYAVFALSDGYSDWVLEEPELQQLYTQVLRTVDRDHQQGLIRQMERHIRDQAYSLFLYNPIKLYAVNKAVDFVPYVSTTLNLAETAVTEQHWSVRKQKAAMPE